jgi:hypothetical protein
MATTTTPVLGLVKATPGTSEPFSTAVVNTNYDKIDLAIGEKATKVTTTTVSNTLTETQIIAKTVVGGTSVQGTVHRLKLWGTYDNSATSTTITLRAKLGGTAMATISWTTPASLLTNRPWCYIADLTCLTTGAGATWAMVLTGHHLNSATHEPRVDATPSPSTNTKDSTVNQTFEITIQWGATSASNVFRADAGHYERVSNA